MQKKDFIARGPVGVHLGQAPHIAQELFVGRRSELEKIGEFLRPFQEPPKQRRLVLGGIGGVGKTQLAIAYAESRSGSYSSVFWLNAMSEAALQNSFQSIASIIFDFQDPRLLESKHIVGHVHQWLSSSSIDTRWLLIFDNYDDPTQFDINDYCPPASYGSIIVTTRQPDDVAGIHLHIKPFQGIEDGLAILQTRSRRKDVLLGIQHTYVIHTPITT